MATKTSTATITLTASGQTVVSGETFFPGSRTLTANINGSAGTFTNGAGGAGTVDLVAYVKDTIALGSPSTPVVHDLEAMTDFNNDAVDFAHVRVIAKQVASGPADSKVIMGDSGTDAFEDAIFNGTTPAVEIPLTGVFLLTKPAGSAGWAVTTNETDLEHDAGTIASDVVLESFYAGND